MVNRMLEHLSILQLTFRILINGDSRVGYLQSLCQFCCETWNTECSFLNLDPDFAIALERSQVAGKVYNTVPM